MKAHIGLLLAFISPTLTLIPRDDVGKLPALGWNSWNAYFCDIDEEKVLTSASRLVQLGLKDAGYVYVNIDDCWSVKEGRDNVTQRLIPDPGRFPDGIDGTAARIHAMGLKVGIYSSAGTQTCANYPASLGYEEIDAATFAEWKIDYLKYDNCNFPSNWTDSCSACVPDQGNPSDFSNGTCVNSSGHCPPGYDYSQSHTAERFRIMRDALQAQNRAILYSLCEWGLAGVQQWGNATGSSWRATGDITPYWSRVLEILNQNSFYLNSVDFWGHSDADMLEVGNGDLTSEETRSHFSLWAAMKSPLLIGTALDSLSQENVDILKNEELLAFHQDDLFGYPATPYKWGTNPDWTFNATFPAEFWQGDYKKGKLVLILNTGGEAVVKAAVWSEIPGLENGGKYMVTDAWTREELGCKEKQVDMEVESHDTAVLVIQEGCGSGIKKGKEYQLGGGGKYYERASKWMELH